MTLSQVLTVLPLVLIGLVGIALVALIIYACGSFIGLLVRLALKDRTPVAQLYARRAKLIAVIGLTALLAHAMYFAVYPGDDFYLAEVELATKRKPPTDTVVVAKHATYPDLHGDYCSFSRLRMSNASYEGYLAAIRADSSFTYTSTTGESTGNVVELGLPPIQGAHFFSRNDVKPDHHYSILFMADNAHVEVHICVT